MQKNVSGSGEVKLPLPWSTVGPDSPVGIATRYGMDDPVSKPGGEGVGRDLPHPSKPVLVPSQPPVQWVSGFVLRVKVVGAWLQTYTPI